MKFGDYIIARKLINLACKPINYTSSIHLDLLVVETLTDVEYLKRKIYTSCCLPARVSRSTCSCCISPSARTHDAHPCPPACELPRFAICPPARELMRRHRRLLTRTWASSNIHSPTWSPLSARLYASRRHRRRFSSAAQRKRKKIR
jgi:hypothetical protein